MKPVEIRRRRLSNQGLTRPRFRAAPDVVGWLCAVQAQDYAAAKWAVGSRIQGGRDSDVERAFDEGSILRTHLLRPTWHFVLPADIRWVLALTGPRIRATSASRLRQLEIDRATERRANRALERSLRDGHARTRDELRTALQRAGIETDGQRMAYLLMLAELEAIVCSGPRRGRQLTYASLDARAPVGRPLARDEALAELAGRYFASRGPASVRDFAKWAGLTAADARTGLEAVADALASEVVADRTLWFSPRPAARLRAPHVRLLSIYDEYVGGYRDRSDIVEPEHAAELMGTGNALTAVVAVDGRIVGAWKRKLSRNTADIEIRWFEEQGRAARAAVGAEIRRYRAFLGMPVTLRTARARP